MYSVKRKKFLVYLGLGLMLFARFIERVNITVPNQLIKYLIYLSCIILFIDILCKKIKKDIFISFISLFCVLIIDSLPSGFHEILFLLWVCVAIRNEEMDSIISFYTLMLALFMIIILVFTRMGIIENLCYIQGERRRYCEGYSSWSILPFQFLSFSYGYVYIRKASIKIVELVLLLFIGLVIYSKTDTKVAFAFLVLLLFGSFLLKKKKHFSFTKIVAIFPWIMFAISVGVSVIYRYCGLSAFDGLLNGRLSLQEKALHLYGIKMLCRPISWTTEPGNYLFVDNSYISLLIIWGVVGITVILIMYQKILDYGVINDDKYLICIVLLILTECLFWSRLITYVDSFFILFFSRTYSEKKFLLEQRSKKEVLLIREEL